MKTILKAFNAYDNYLNNMEERHPYITGFIGMSALFAFFYVVILIGKYAGY